jgi:hypothetical protein
LIRARRGALANATVSALAAMTVLAACNDTFRFDDAPPAPGDGVDAGGDEQAPAADATTSRCTSDSTCGDLRCDLASGACVACVGDGDCSADRPRCDSASHLCVECEGQSDCTQREICNATTHRCIDTCTDADDPCPHAGFVCDGTLRLCVECRSSANCAGFPSSPICDIPIGRCVQCTGNAQCPSSSPVCDRRSGQCVGCLTSAACPAGMLCGKTTLTCR